MATDPAVQTERVDYGAYRCQTCGEQSSWYLMRKGDVVVSWACSPHLADELIGLQREEAGGRPTEVVVTFRWEA